MSVQYLQEQVRKLERSVAQLAEENVKLKEALIEIAKGQGRFSLDHFQHCKNTIEDMKDLAVTVLKEAENDKGRPQSTQEENKVVLGTNVPGDTSSDG